jgi:hypothetical protein
VQTVFDSWAKSSTKSEASVAMQIAASKITGDNPELKGTVPSVYGKGKSLYEKHSEVFDKVANIIYNDTQTQLKEAGVEKVTLFRGMTVPRHIKTGDLNLDMNPLSSFAMNYTTASTFSTEENQLGHSAVVLAEVPRERIFSLATQGLGCLTESEVLVTGEKPLKAKIAVVKPEEFSAFNDMISFSKLFEEYEE